MSPSGGLTTLVDQDMTWSALNSVPVPSSAKQRWLAMWPGVSTASSVQPGASTPAGSGRFENVAKAVARKNKLRTTVDFAAIRAAGLRLGSLKQGYVEGSNVNMVEELVTMIQTQRAYELNSKVISTSDAMLGKLTQL